jgi:hypothetical protein
MLIPRNSVIPLSKVRDYLLKPRFKADKSRYLGIAGYSRENAGKLIADIQEQLLPGDAHFQRGDRYGEYYSLCGFLRGPNGRRIGVETIWIRDVEGTIRFLTLFPD